MVNNEQFAAQLKQLQTPIPQMNSPLTMPTYPVYTPMQMNSNQLPRMQVSRVNGRKGAESFKLGPDSSVFLMDTVKEVIWAVTTDSAGEKTITQLAVTVVDEEAEEKKAGEELKVSIQNLAKKLEENTTKIEDLEKRFKEWEGA